MFRCRPDGDRYNHREKYGNDESGRHERVTPGPGHMSLLAEIRQRRIRPSRVGDTKAGTHVTVGRAPDGKWTVVKRRTRQSMGKCAKCGETNHVTATCRHADKVLCRQCGERGHKEKHHTRD